MYVIAHKFTNPGFQNPIYSILVENPFCILESRRPTMGARFCIESCAFQLFYFFILFGQVESPGFDWSNFCFYCGVAVPPC